LRRLSNSLVELGYVERISHETVRQWLYMSTLALLRYQPDVPRWVGELKARGKSNPVVIVAIMRTLLPLVHGVLKSGHDYDPCQAFPSPDASSLSTREASAPDTQPHAG
jgi:hypothetical protein